MRRRAAPAGLGLVLGLLLAGHSAPAIAREPETVHFPSADGKTTLVGYLVVPEGAGPHPAIVLLHGRGGVYSSLARGGYNATTISKRHRAWSEFWEQRGYVALLVDSFGPRGYAGGFPRGSYKQRPAAVSEQTVRPLDAYGALAYLRQRRDVVQDRVGIQGWSNGAMTALVAVADTAPGITRPTPATGFRAALALYPGCHMDSVKGRYVPYAPLLMLLAAADVEVSPVTCAKLAERTKAAGGPLETVLYEGAEHGFDDPSTIRQGRDANRRATEDAYRRAEQFFRTHLTPP